MSKKQFAGYVAVKGHSANRMLLDRKRRPRWVQSPTYGDYLILPGLSKCEPSQTDTRSWIARGVPCRVPFLSAAMQTVTEVDMAIAMAKAGGAGVIHYDMPAKDQARMVKRVRFEQLCFIETPIPTYADLTIAEHVANCEKWVSEGKRDFDKFPVLNREQEVVGFVAESDLRFCKDKRVLIGKIMTPIDKLVTAPSGTTPKQAYKICCDQKVSALLTISRNRKRFGMYLFKDLERRFESNDAGYNVDAAGQLIVLAAVGVGPAHYERVEMLVDAGVSLIVVDSAHAHTVVMEKMVRWCKRSHGTPIMAGNVATREAGIFLARAGADAIKVGIGPGSICTTRDVAGVGVPQLQAVFDVSDGVRRFNIPTCADGGISPDMLGAIAKALAAGGSTAMGGNVVAGTNEAPGDVVYVEGRPYRAYSGMAAPSALVRSKTASIRYRQSEKHVPEGEDGAVPSKGPVGDVMRKIHGALQITLGYVGARNISEFQRKAVFDPISDAAKRESTSHDITVLKS